MYGQETLSTALNTVAIIATVDLNVEGNPAIFADTRVPQNCPGRKTINFYLSETFDARQESNQYVYTINCRADTNNESLLIAKTVIDEINRVDDSNKYISCQLLPTLGPGDDTDNYNTPVRAWVVTK